MKISQDGIRLYNWQFFLVFLLAVFFIGAMTYTSIQSQKAKIEQVKLEQKEKSERGHWLWGHWDDVAEKKDE